MTREEKRNYRAEKLCREVRFQLSEYGEIKNLGKLYDFVIAWENVAKKNKNIRPNYN